MPYVSLEVRSKPPPSKPTLRSWGLEGVEPCENATDEGVLEVRSVAAGRSVGCAELSETADRSKDPPLPKRVGICGLWELPTTQVTPGRAASSSGARWT